MRILVVSDTHGDFYSFNRAVLAQPAAEVIIHLGDGEAQAEDIRSVYKDKTVLNVRGNCDWCPLSPLYILRRFEGKTVFATHGHEYGVKYSLETAIKHARKNGADILLYGHTHIPLTDYRDGLYIMNPGSLRGSGGTYGIVDITNAGIVTNIVKL